MDVFGALSNLQALGHALPTSGELAREYGYADKVTKHQDVLWDAGVHGRLPESNWWWHGIAMGLHMDGPDGGVQWSVELGDDRSGVFMRWEPANDRRGGYYGYPVVADEIPAAYLDTLLFWCWSEGVQAGINCLKHTEGRGHTLVGLPESGRIDFWERRAVLAANLVAQLLAARNARTLAAASRARAGGR